MNKALAATLACMFCAAASGQGTSQPTEPRASPAAESRPPINTRLDETPKPRPRITFGPRVPAGEQAGGGGATLPSLGATPGSPAGSFDGAASDRVPYPKDTNPYAR